MVFKIISGSWPPEVCGCGDFAHGLLQAMLRAGYNAKPFTLKKYDVLRSFTLLIGSHTSNARQILVYPTEGYGYSLLPFLLALGSRDNVILYCHEYATKNKYCRWLLRLFRWHSTILFGNEFDRNLYCSHTAHTPGSSLQRIATGIPSNIPVACARGNRDSSCREAPVLCHFGQIRTNKGLEELLQVFTQVKANHPAIRLRLIGGYPSAYEKYASSIISRFQDLGVELCLNGSPEEVSMRLGECDAFVSMYPEGVCERRGSLMAALSHGLTCYSTDGIRTPEFFHALCKLYPCPQGSEDRSAWIRGFARWLGNEITMAAAVPSGGTSAEAFIQERTFDGIARRVFNLANRRMD